MSAMLAIRYMSTRPRIPYVLSSPTAVPGSVNAVEMTPIAMLGATNAMAAATGCGTGG